MYVTRAFALVFEYATESFTLFISDPPASTAVLDIPLFVEWEEGDDPYDSLRAFTAGEWVVTAAYRQPEKGSPRMLAEIRIANWNERRQKRITFDKVAFAILESLRKKAQYAPHRQEFEKILEDRDYLDHLIIRSVEGLLETSDEQFETTAMAVSHYIDSHHVYNLLRPENLAKEIAEAKGE